MFEESSTHQTAYQNYMKFRNRLFYMHMNTMLVVRAALFFNVMYNLFILVRKYNSMTEEEYTRHYENFITS